MSRVTLYTTTTCNPCRLVARKLDAAGIAHEKVVLDLEGNEARLDDLKARMGVDMLQTPVLEVDGAVVMRGLQPAVLDDVIASTKAAA